MMYRKKPVVIEAIQWNGSMDGMLEINKHWPLLDTTGTTTNKDTHTVFMWNIRTLEGQHRVGVGDYIIKGVKGEFYPCKPDIFAMTYESALAVSAPTQARPLADAARIEYENYFHKIKATCSFDVWLYAFEKGAASKIANPQPAPAPWVRLTDDDIYAIPWPRSVLGMRVFASKVQKAFIDKQGAPAPTQAQISQYGSPELQELILAKLTVTLSPEQLFTHPAKPNSDHHRTLSKWLNEEQTGPIDRIALAHVLSAAAQTPLARLLTEAEIFKTLTTQCINLTEACVLLQRKFCEVNNITLRETT